jgi:hypothetical protein
LRRYTQVPVRYTQVQVPVCYTQVPVRYTQIQVPVCYTQVPVRYTQVPVRYTQVPVRYTQVPVRYTQVPVRYTELLALIIRKLNGRTFKWPSFREGFGISRLFSIVSFLDKHTLFVTAVSWCWGSKFRHSSFYILTPKTTHASTLNFLSFVNQHSLHFMYNS